MNREGVQKLRLGEFLLESDGKDTLSSHHVPLDVSPFLRTRPYFKRSVDEPCVTRKICSDAKVCPSDTGTGFSTLDLLFLETKIFSETESF